MKTLLLIGALFMGTFSPVGQAAPQINNESHHYGTVETKELKKWYDSGKKMIVVDARSKPYFDGTLLPQAIWIPYDAPENELHQKLPKKNSLIVVYCWSPQCPASQYLVDRLVAEGYTNVYKYPEGLQEWMRQGLPIHKN